MSDDTQMQAIYDRLTTGDEYITTEDYDAIVEYFAEDIPYGVLKGRTGTVDEWFLNRWEQLCI
jgi:hypothetical protein